MDIDSIYNKVINGNDITYEEALNLSEYDDLEKLSKYADNIRKHFCGDSFDICSIINAKSGKCSEDCKFCAQSAHYKSDTKEYPLIDKESIVNEAVKCAEKGVMRFSIVISGKRMTDKDTDIIAEAVSEIRNKTSMQVCASLGLLTHEQFNTLKKAGLGRVHNNIETSEEYFSEVCSTHSFADKITALKTAISEGLEVCSGGIIGMGESMQDRISMAFVLRELNVQSVPINVLNPIKGTPYEKQEVLSYDEVLRTCAVFRFILPKAFIRLAGGRILLEDKGRKAFLSGINAVITGDMLTTNGISIDEDMKIIEECGYRAG